MTAFEKNLTYKSSNFKIDVEFETLGKKLSLELILLVVFSIFLYFGISK